MDLNRKLEIAKASIRSISQHDNAERAVRAAALKSLEDFIVAEGLAADVRLQRKIDAALAQKD